MTQLFFTVVDKLILMILATSRCQGGLVRKGAFVNVNPLSKNRHSVTATFFGSFHKYKMTLC